MSEDYPQKLNIPKFVFDQTSEYEDEHAQLISRGVVSR